MQFQNCKKAQNWIAIYSTTTVLCTVDLTVMEAAAKRPHKTDYPSKDRVAWQEWKDILLHSLWAICNWQIDYIQHKEGEIIAGVSKETDWPRREATIKSKEAWKRWRAGDWRSSFGSGKSTRSECRYQEWSNRWRWMSCTNECARQQMVLLANIRTSLFHLSGRGIFMSQNLRTLSSKRKLSADQPVAEDFILKSRAFIKDGQYSLD